MNSRLSSIPDFLKVPVVGIVRNMSMENFVGMLPVFHKAGLIGLEITMNTKGAAEMIGYANEHFGNQLIVGAGTVLTNEDLLKALDAGARFVVTPVTDDRVIDSCVKNNIPVMPGAFTPSEIYRAWSAGAAIVKLFPATSLGPQYIKDVKAPLNEVDIMPTGGIDEKNMGSFFAAGAVAVGVGGNLFDAGMMKAKNWKALHDHFRNFVNAVPDHGSILRMPVA